MSEIKLLPCPFCGGEAEVCGYYFIQCTKCGSSTLTHTNREEAIKAWNTRKPMERIVEQLEKPIWIVCNEGMNSDELAETAIEQTRRVCIDVVKRGGSDEMDQGRTKAR